MAFGSSAVEKSHAISFAYRGPSRHLFLTYTLVQLGSSGAVENKWAVADTFAKYRTLSSCGVPMDMEAGTKKPNLESTCLGHGHVKPC